MPQVKGKVYWLENTHLALPQVESVRIDNSEVTIENDRMEEAKQQMLDTLHLEKHRAFLGQQQEIKTAKSHVYKYKRVKDVIDPKKGVSCSLLVRRSKSFVQGSSNLTDKSSDEFNPNKSLPHRSYSWSNVSLPENSNSWDSEFGHLPPVPFAKQPLKMRHIPSVPAHANTVSVYRGQSKISANVFSRKRTEILNQKDSQIGRSYQTLKELSDVTKLSENGKGALRERVVKERNNILSLYNDDLRRKIQDFHTRMDTFITENRNAPKPFTEQRTLPKIY